MARFTIISQLPFVNIFVASQASNIFFLSKFFEVSRWTIMAFFTVNVSVFTFQSIARNDMVKTSRRTNFGKRFFVVAGFAIITIFAFMHVFVATCTV